MWIYYLLLVCCGAGIIGIYARKRGARDFFRYFKKSGVVTIIEPKIPIENNGSIVSHCPAIALADENAKPEIDKADRKEIKIAMEKGRTSVEKADLTAAEKNFVKVLSFDENNLEANLSLGLIYLKKGLAAKAEAIYKKLIDLKCADAVIHSNLGNAYYQQNKFESAREAYEKAVELDPQNPRRMINLGCVLHEMKNFDAAIEYISKAIALDNNPDYHATMADVYISLGNLGRAKEIIDSGRAIDKKNSALKVVSKKLKMKRKNRD